MTAPWSDTERGPRAQRPRPSDAGELEPIDAFLRAVPRYWGIPLSTDGSAFAALRFDASPGSASRTRSFLRTTLANWQLDELTDDAATVAAELVANAVTHALCSSVPSSPPPRGTAWLALIRMEGAVVCAVADPSPRLPEPAEPDEFAESGRGLRIVAELSASWGYSAPAPAGKTVWARLVCDDAGAMTTGCTDASAMDPGFMNPGCTDAGFMNPGSTGSSCTDAGPADAGHTYAPPPDTGRAGHCCTGR